MVSINNIPKLGPAKKRARRALQRFREERREAVREYLGAHWSDEGSRNRVPINMIGLYISIVGRQLIAKNPRVMLSTFQRAHKPTVAAMESWANDQIEKMALDNAFQRIVLDALFTLGIAKVGLASAADAATSGWIVEAGQPYCERVDIDDFAYDTRSHDFREASFLCHRIWVPLDVIQSDKRYNKNRKDVVTTDNAAYNEEGDERIGMLGRGYQCMQDDYEERAPIWEYYLPRHKAIVTLDDNDRLLAEEDWIGPESGPFTFNGYGMVPGNAMPKAPIQDLIDEHQFINAIYRKLMRQSLRQKTILAVRSEEEANRVVNTNDGEGFASTGQEPKEVSFGGPNQMNTGMFMQAKQLFSFMADNMDLIGGAGAQSPTATQDKILNENAHATLADKQTTTINFVAATLKNLCWYFHHDPFTTQKSVYSVPGMPHISTIRQVGPRDRIAIPWDEMQVKVDPYSMQYSTPRKRLADLNQIVQTIVPMMSMLQAQGKNFDIDTYLNKVAKYLDQPDLAEIIATREPVEATTTSQAGQPSPNTTRTYERVSRSERTQGGTEKAMMQQMMAGNPGGAHEGNGKVMMGG